MLITLGCLRYDGDLLHLTDLYYIAEGQKHGQGVYSYAQGESFHGTFNRGKIVGKGRMTYSDNSAIEGQYAEVEDLPRITK
jgi:hypothetical protein